jgi:predicted Rossmann fold flavoprotein
MTTNSTEAPSIAIIGGGAAGFFAALSAAGANPKAKVILYEKGKRFLQKVKISGGGRCNVTHSCFEPAQLSTHYPRGARELRAAFHRWQPRDTIAWFEQRGVAIKKEADGRMFPTTDDSQTIIDCFRNEARTLGIRTQTGCGLKTIQRTASGRFQLNFEDGSVVEADAVCLAVGSLKNTALSASLKTLGHSVETLAPSLFAFNVNDTRLHDLAGLAVPTACVQALPKGKPQIGPLLITHRGLSGPAVLRASAWGAREIQAQDYHFKIAINWLGLTTENQLQESFNALRKSSPRKAVKNTPIEPLPRRLWERLVNYAGIADDCPWAQLPKKAAHALLQECIAGRYAVQGKTTNKDEFVTCGGIRLKEIDFRKMESKSVPGLHFAGECLDFDGITGGFNFQAAWTSGYIAGLAMAETSTE